MARRPLLPERGNPMRPMMIYLAAVFGVMLVGFTALMLDVGVGVGGTIAIAIVIVVVAVIILAVVRYLADAYEEGRQSMLAGDTLAEWRLSRDEHRRFLAAEQRSNRQVAAIMTVLGVGLGLFLGFGEDWVFGGIMIGSFLFAAVIALTLGGPPRSAGSEAGRDVLIGTSGVQVLDRYLPFHAPMTRLRGVELQPGDPAVLRFTIRSGNRAVGRRSEEIRVPVPHDRLAEAQSLAELLRHEASQFQAT